MVLNLYYLFLFFRSASEKTGTRHSSAHLNDFHLLCGSSFRNQGDKNIIMDTTRVMVLVMALVLGPLIPGQALGCGMPLAARIPAEQALIQFINGREEIVTSVQLQADRPGAAVIFPVPGVSEVSALTNNDLFEYLAEVTRPEVRTEEIAIGPGTQLPVGEGAPGGGVNLLGREIIGGYDVARLEADDTAALQAWLDQNGYAAPAGAAPILSAYIGEGWKFVAVKLAAQQTANGTLAPLRMAFDTTRIIYPMRLGALADAPLDVLLYILADHRGELAQMTTEYAGPVTQLERPPPTELAALFRAPYLTKMRNTGLAPASLTEDFVIGQAASDASYRMVTTRTVYVTREPNPASGNQATGWSVAAPIIGVALAFIASTIALGLALGLRKRIDVIAGPKPKDEEDD